MTVLWLSASLLLLLVSDTAVRAEGEAGPTISHRLNPTKQGRSSDNRLEGGKSTWWYPLVVRLTWLNHVNDMHYRGAGVLYKPDLIVSVAHLFDDITEHRYELAFCGRQMRQIISVTRHHQYGADKNYDVVLLGLNKPFFISSWSCNLAVLPKVANLNYTSQNLTVVGYKSSTSVYYYRTLLRMMVQTDEDCKDEVTGFNKEIQLCMKDPDAQQSACREDDGYPVLSRYNEVVGLVSKVADDCATNRSLATTFVRLSPFTNFFDMESCRT